MENAVKDVKDFGIRIQHAGIHCKNYEETFRWYHEIFGFEEVPPRPGGSPFKGGVFPKMKWIYLGDFFMEVYEVQDAEPFSFVDFEFTLGMKHINFAIKDIEGWLAYVKARGDVDIVVENQYSPDSYAVYLRDNNGILVEVTSDIKIGG